MATNLTRQQIKDRLSRCGGLSYADFIRFLDAVAFLTDIEGGTSLSATLRTVIRGGDQVSINWMTDTLPDNAELTYFQKHGTYPLIVEENQDPDSLIWSQNTAPAYQWDATREIITFSPQTENTNFIIL